jgi:hypothetical protein
MKDIEIFPANGTNGIWCKGNLHTHTKNSDGILSPEEVVAKYKEMGHDFISLTDHNRYIYNKHLHSDDFIVIPGFEVDLNPPGTNMCHHIVAVRSKVSAQNYHDGYEFIHPEYKGLETVQEVIDDLNAHDNFAFYCHPIWSRVDIGDFIGLNRLAGMEIFNTGCHLENNTGYSPAHTDDALRQGKMRYIFATDDCHHYNNDRGKGYIVVKADEKSEESIVDAILKGRFYSSRAPEIYEFGIKNNEVYIKCSDVREIHFIAYEPLGRSFVGEKGELKNSASCGINENWTYVRAEIVDDNGYQAWTNPIFLK